MAQLDRVSVRKARLDATLSTQLPPNGRVCRRLFGELASESASITGRLTSFFDGLADATGADLLRLPADHVPREQPVDPRSDFDCARLWSMYERAAAST